MNKIYSNTAEFIDKYLAGKRDHTINREWNLQKGMFGWAAGYLLLREVQSFLFSCPSEISTLVHGLCFLHLLCIIKERELLIFSIPTSMYSETNSLKKTSATIRPTSTWLIPSFLTQTTRYLNPKFGNSTSQPTWEKHQRSNCLN